jgi:hypothetical protein
VGSGYRGRYSTMHIYRYEVPIHFLRFTTVVVLLFSDFVGFNELWHPISFAYPPKKEGADNTVCVPFT